jgi:hypothetical protein
LDVIDDVVARPGNGTASQVSQTPPAGSSLYILAAEPQPIGMGGGGPKDIGGGQASPAEAPPAVAPKTPFTVFELPYAPPPRFEVVRADTGAPIIWRRSTEDPRRIEVDGLVGGLPLFGGERYDFLYTFGEPNVRTQTQAGGITAVTNDRLQLLRFRVNHNRSGPFRLDLFEATGRLLGRSSYTPLYYGGGYRRLATGTGTFSIPVRMKSDRARVRIWSPFFLPCWFISAEWEANLVKYGRSLG